MHKTKYTLKFKSGAKEYFNTLEAAREALQHYTYGSCWIIAPLYN